MTEITIRDYRPGDRDACLGIFDGNVPRFFVPAERAEFATFLDDLPGPYLVIEDARGRVIGCGGYALAPDRRSADICWDMIRPERLGTGLGRRLLEARLARLRADPRVETVALNTSQLTRGFYERFGFTTERVVPDGYAPGLDRCDMRLDLRRARRRSGAAAPGSAGPAPADRG